MIKKCLIAIAVVALLVTTVQAGDTYPAIKEEGTWPWTKIYDEMDICTMPVKLEVGHYVQIYKCNKLEIKLVQVPCDTIGKSGKFPCYEDCVDIKARANFPATFGARFDDSDSDLDTDIIGDNHSLDWGPPDDDEIEGTGSWEDLKLCMTAWEVELWNSGKTSGWLKVGEITLTVKPQNETFP